MLDFADRLSSAAFAQLARHPAHPQAFTRCRKLPLPALVAALLTMRGQSQQAMLDGFFASVCDVATLQRLVSDRAFAKARERLHMPALGALNDMVVKRADAAGFVPRWRGLRVVAADASVLRPALRQCLRTRCTAAADQRLFALYLPGAELTLHASVHSSTTSERAMLVEALDALGPDDVLVLDRGYPASWLLALLNRRGIRYVIRCDNDSGWAVLRPFVRSARVEQWVSLKPPSLQEAQDWDCGTEPPRVRLVRQVAPSGAVRVLATNLDIHEVPAEAFGELYHQRWRIEEAFKRLKHRLALEAVSGLSQQALLVDVAAKILADNLTSLMCMAAQMGADMLERSRKCVRSYAATAMSRTLPRLVLAIGDLPALVAELLHNLAARWQRHRPGRSRPRPAQHGKPHPSCVYKGG